jgi:hypothetical protein
MMKNSGALCFELNSKCFMIIRVKNTAAYSNFVLSPFLVNSVT